MLKAPTLRGACRVEVRLAEQVLRFRVVRSERDRLFQRGRRLGVLAQVAERLAEAEVGLRRLGSSVRLVSVVMARL